MGRAAGPEVGRGGAEACGGVIEWGDDIGRGCEAPIIDQPRIANSQCPLVRACSELENGWDRDADIRSVTGVTRGENEPGGESETPQRTCLADPGIPEGGKGDVSEAFDRLVGKPQLLARGVGVRQGRAQDYLIADSIGRTEINALEDRRDLVRVRDFVGALVDFVAFSIRVVEREAESGGFELV